MTNPIDLRPSLAAYLNQRLSALRDGFRHNIAVLGPVGSGKTTLLKEVLASCDASLVKIYCAIQRDTIREFLQRFAAALLRSSLIAPPDEPLEQLLERSGTSLPKTTAAIWQLERYAASPLQAEAFVHALDVIPILHQETKRPCVLALDEFLHLEELGLLHVFHELGKRVMTWPFALFLVSSSSIFRARSILRERLHLLFGQLELVSLGAVEQDAARVWIKQELPCATTQLASFLLDWIGSSPWYLSVLINRIKELARLKRMRRITEAVMFQAAWDVLGSPDGVLYQWCAAQMDRLVHQRHGPLARQALLQIAGGARTTQAIAKQCSRRGNLCQALQVLLENDLVERKGTCWMLPDQLFACWTAFVFGVSQGSGLLDREAAFALFEQALQSAWTKWCEATSLPLADRINHLLSRFCNETVSLDHKTGHLPAFQSRRLQPNPSGQEAYVVADGDERRWCCLVHEGRLGEAGVAAFDQFCRRQSPRPSRKIVVARAGLEPNATLLAKEANMWVWEPQDVNLLFLLYGQAPLGR